MGDRERFAFCRDIACRRIRSGQRLGWGVATISTAKIMKHSGIVRISPSFPNDSFDVDAAIIAVEIAFGDCRQTQKKGSK
jgi:hypothetical protein